MVQHHIGGFQAVQRLFFCNFEQGQADAIAGMYYQVKRRVFDRRNYIYAGNFVSLVAEQSEMLAEILAAKSIAHPVSNIAWMMVVKIRRAAAFPYKFQYFG